MKSPTDGGRDEFLGNVRKALGRPHGSASVPNADAAALSQGDAAVDERARSIISDAEARAEELMSQLEMSASQLGWNVARWKQPEQAAQYIEELARDSKARSVVRSAHSVLERLKLDERLAGLGVEVQLMAVEVGAQESDISQRRSQLREQAIHADLGITGADYAIAETGSCVLLAGKGVSRLVGLLPPVHIVVVQKGQVLPGLDELFTLRRRDFLQGRGGSYMNIISGPSRSADIEQTLVTGVHGPGEVHMVMLG